MIQHTLGLLARPTSQWRKIAALEPGRMNLLLLYPVDHGGITSGRVVLRNDRSGLDRG